MLAELLAAVGLCTGHQIFIWMWEREKSFIPSFISKGSVVSTYLYSVCTPESRVNKKYKKVCDAQTLHLLVNDLIHHDSKRFLSSQPALALEIDTKLGLGFSSNL